MQNDSHAYVQNTIRVHDGTFTREVNGNTVTESVFQDQQSVERSGRRHEACVQLTIVYDAASQQLISTSFKVVPHGSWQVTKQMLNPSLKGGSDQPPAVPGPTTLPPSVQKQNQELPPLGGDKVGKNGTYVGEIPSGQQIESKAAAQENSLTREFTGTERTASGLSEDQLTYALSWDRWKQTNPVPREPNKATRR